MTQHWHQRSCNFVTCFSIWIVVTQGHIHGIWWSENITAFPCQVWNLYSYLFKCVCIVAESTSYLRHTCLPACPSVRSSAFFSKAHSGWIYVKFSLTSVKICQKIPVLYKVGEKISDALREDVSTLYCLRPWQQPLRLKWHNALRLAEEV